MNTWRLLLFLPLAGVVCAAEFRTGDYGAKGDGRSINTVAIQKTIDAAGKVGGTVIFTPGIYLTGALFLRSGIQFRVDKGVVLRGVQDHNAYPLIPTRVAGIEMKWPAALINVYEQSHVQISGEGFIDGDGKMWWDSYWKLRAEYDPKGIRWAADYDCRRPRLIQIYRSANVELRGVTLERSGFWTVHICYSRHITVDGITIRNNISGRGPSTDGVDVDSSSDVLVQNCDIECNDDAVVLKAGRDADGLRVNLPTEYIVVRNNTVRAGTAGIAFGSETSGGIRHIEVYGIHVLPTVLMGIFFKSARTRGGTLEDIAIHDMDIRGVTTAFRIELNWYPSYSYAKIPSGMRNVPDYWRVLAEPVPVEKGLPHLRNIRAWNIRAFDVQEAFSASAFSEAPVENLSFSNIEIHAQRAGTIRNASNWKFSDSRIETTDGSRVKLIDSRGVMGLLVN